MKTILQFALVLVLFAGTFAAGYYFGKRQKNEQLSAEMVEHKAVNDSLLRQYERIKINQMVERERYDKIIKALSNDATADKIDRIIRSMDASSTQR